MNKFKCPTCSRKCKLNKKMSKLRNLPESARVYQWECDGQSAQAPHPPTVFMVESLSIMIDKTGRITSRVDKVTRLWLEDSNLYELMDEFKAWMAEQRYRRLPAAAV